MQGQLAQSCHDISDGGLLCCLVECCFGNDLGAKITLDHIHTLEHLFGEWGARFIMTVRSEKVDEVSELLGDKLHYLGAVQKDHLVLMEGSKELIRFSVQRLKDLWRSL